MGSVRVDIVEAIYDKEGVSSQECRPHLGGSQIGKECERSIYLGFRWAKSPSFGGRMLRLFRRGHEEEEKLVKLLQSVGFQIEEVDPETGDQWHFEIIPGFSNNLDGIGIVEGDKVLLEFKTHNDRSFKSLEKNGVEASKPEHFAQMQTYMGASGLQKALYMAVNKNDDSLYVEMVDFNPDVYEGLISKAKRIMHGWSAPPKSFDPDKRMSPCKWCDFKGVCWEEEKPEQNCRTCSHVKFTTKGEWKCHKHCVELSTEDQRKGCSDYEMFKYED